MSFSGITSSGAGYQNAFTPAAPKVSSAGSTALITSAVVSGLGEMANSFINAGRVRATAKFNQQMAEIQGKMVKTVARYEIARIRQRSDSLFSRQRALYAKSGVTFDGSPAAVMTESLKQAELDAFAVEINAEMGVWANNAQARINANEASGATSAAITGSAKTILKTATFVAMNTKALKGAE